MGRDVRSARAVLAAAMVAATVLLGIGYAQASPQVTASEVPTGPAVVPTRPALTQDRPARPERAASNAAPQQRSSVGGADRADERLAPGRLPAAAPHSPQATPRRAEPPAQPSGSGEPRHAGGTASGAPAGAPAGEGDPPPLVAGTPCTAAARACVDLNVRQAWLLDAGKVVRGPVPIQHGDVRSPTPRGKFKVQWKAEQYTSRQYLTQMPYSVFFAEGGIAFHEGAQDNPSAGCVKLGREDAKAFFYFLLVGDEVQIH
jgi:hypothetical protein